MKYLRFSSTQGEKKKKKGGGSHLELQRVPDEKEDLSYLGRQSSDAAKKEEKSTKREEKERVSIVSQATAVYVHLEGWCLDWGDLHEKEENRWNMKRFLRSLRCSKKKKREKMDEERERKTNAQEKKNQVEPGALEGEKKKKKASSMIRITEMTKDVFLVKQREEQEKKMKED